MATNQSELSELGIQRSQFEVGTIYCYLDAGISRRTSRSLPSHERLRAVEALQLLIRLDRELRHARADWNQDRFRRVMKARAKAVSRVGRVGITLIRRLLLRWGNSAVAIMLTWLVTCMRRESRRYRFRK